MQNLWKVPASPRKGLHSRLVVQLPALGRQHVRSARAALSILVGLCALGPAAAQAADSDVKVSSIGYLPDRAKFGTVTGGGTTFALHKAGSGEVVASGDLGAEGTDETTQEVFRVADFSSVREPGSYYLDVPGVGRSVEFSIGADVFKQQFEIAMLGFYGWRSGTEVQFT